MTTLMQAALVRSFGAPLAIEELARPEPGPGELLVKVMASGVCHTDVHAADGDWAAKPTLPFIPGHEGAGDVIAVGEGVTNVAVGDRVIVLWQPPCGNCHYCLTGRGNLCVNILFTVAGAARFSMGETPVYGMCGTGTMAEEMVLPHESVVKMPDDVSYEIGALIGCGVTTGVGAALNTAKVVPGSSVVVFGCGGVGIAAIQGARICGAAEIVAVDTIPAKFEDAKRFGATHGCTPEGLAELRATKTVDGQGFDYAFECIGLPQTVRAAYDAVCRGGTVVVVGAGRAEATIAFNGFELFFDEKKILGSYFGSADARVEFPRIIRLWRAGRLDLEGMITARLDLSDVNEAFAALQKGDAIRQVLQISK